MRVVLERRATRVRVLARTDKSDKMRTHHRRPTDVKNVVCVDWLSILAGKQIYPKMSNYLFNV